ncbi:MAG: DUF1549 domain-containing protein [Planctomycetes bacterium]|nr:DUF1549 domain-containing protein [Planctomycetota bacterium]
MTRLQVFASAACCLIAGAGGFSGVTRGAGPEPISFDRDIRPILSDSCYFCHGPDSANRQAGLRLDRRESATTALDGGATAIVAGDPAASALLERITSTDPDLVMPPPEAKLGRLAPEQVDLLRRWIAAGAVYEPHWAFVAPADAPLPPASDSSGDHPLDRIVAERLADRGLALQPEADRATLVRRATFDLTGLPPTPEEVRAFVADGAPDAYERLLDRLLASPRYGERMAADWMDVARYADSYGFQVDRDRPMWPWRDWVIAAFNRNLPWNDFVTWQLAGDLLPGATDEQILATAFNRLHQQEAEGGSVEEEYRVNHVNDRTTTFGTAFLGLTLECARCHDHKFDPVSQREYYQLFAFFDDVDEAGLYSFFTPAVPTPKLALPDEPTRAALARAEAECELALTDVARSEGAAMAAATDWAAGRGTLPADVHRGEVPGELVHYDFEARGGDGKFPSWLSIRDGATSPADNRLVPGRDGNAVALTGDHPVQTPVGNFRRSQPFTIAAWVRVPEAYSRAVLWHRSQAWTDAGSRGYELLVEDGRLKWSLIHFWPGDAASVRTAEPVPTGRWAHVAVTSDGSGRAAGLSIVVDGRPAALETVRDGLSREITGGGGDHVRIGERMRDNGFKGGLVDDFRVFSRRLAPLEIQELVRPGTIRDLVAAPPADPAAAAEAAWLVGGYVAAALDPDVAVARDRLAAARRARDDLAERPAEIMVMRELAVPKTAYVLARGDYDKRRDPVQPDTPAFLPPFPADAPRNRLGLARWLTAPDHPLLARVTVNRVWQGLFGLGLVKTPEDLGSQSPRPEHREALDWLARDFARDWDMKRLLATIMTSRSYRQRSGAAEQVEADDPANVWLARGPRHRLPGEMIRDGILAAAGLLVERVGGPSVNPYDLPESFKPSAAGSGEALYRRSLYTFWRRTGPAPVLESFDVPKRVVCVARRDVTNTPLHALVLLNGPQFVEAARVLAERLLASGAAPDDALVTAFERLTCRPPDEAERAILRDLLAGQREWYAAHPDEAAKLVAVGSMKPAEGVPAVEVAAVAAAVNALMNHDGCVVKR